MNRKTLKTAYRLSACLLLASVITLASIWTPTSASEQAANGVPNSETIAEQIKNGRTPEAVTLKAEKRGYPLINLQDGRKLETQFIGENDDARSAGAVQARPLAMISADLNADGAADLVVGYAGPGGGHLAYYRGSLDTLSARTPEIFEEMKEGRFPAPFLPEARLIDLPLAPDLVGTGDFNRDGYKDIVAAERGGTSIVLLAGDSKGNLKMQSIEMPGRITALMTENIDPADGQVDVAVAVSDANGARLFVFDDQHDVFAEQPRIYPLPGEATSLALGQLDDFAPMDILAAAGGRGVIIHGSYRERTDASATSKNAQQVESLNIGTDIAAVRVGNFVWDRENRPEIALLTSGGTIQILRRGILDTRQYSEEEWEEHWRAQEERDQIELMYRSADPSNRAVQTDQKQVRRATQSWTEADSFQLSSGLNLQSASSASIFTSSRMTSSGVDDLIISDEASRTIKILVQNNEQLQASGESYNLSAKGGRALIEIDAAETPAAVLPMRLGVMTRPGLVTLSKESAEISYAVAAPAATFTVTKTADTFDGTCDADCSLREAIRAANLAAGADLVSVPAGTYTLTIGPSDDSPADPSAQGSGDLDVRGDLTITGAGQATTIIQAGASAATGIDRVLHTRQTSLGIPDVSISGVTIRHGRCSSAGSVANPNGARCNTGGAGLLHSVDDLGAVTISDSTFTTNWNVATNAGTGQFFLNGAGIFIGRGDTVFTNVTFTNNENGATGSDHGGDGGAVLFGFSSATNINTAVLNNVTMTGNIARKIGSDTLGGQGGGLNQAYDDVDINGGTYSNNSADLDGGALYLLTKTDVFNNVSVTGNTAKRDGGGIWSDPLNTDGSPATNTFASVILRNNTADSDGTTNLPGDPRGAGGGIYHDRGTLSLTSITIGGTSAGHPNTSFDGGGLGHRYRAQASTNNISTITVNGGAIVGNVANNDGGGIFHDATRTAGANSTLSLGPTTQVTLTDNKAKNNGGGVSNSGGAGATLNNMQLRSNQANSDNSGGGDGGALYQNNGTSTFTGILGIGGAGLTNSAVNGGGIRNNAGTVTIPSGASITHNTATGTGGGISNAGTLSALTNTTLTNNTATGNGGGIHNTGTLGTLSNLALDFNTAATGGGIFSSNGALTINGGSVNGNTSTGGKGGGVEHSGTSASAITGAIVQNNTGSGIHITGTGSIDVSTTAITGNSGDGITKIGTGNGSHFDSNVIHSNGELGIDLSDNAVTPNDANDTDSGPNNLQNFPVINWVRRGDGIGNVTLNAPNGKYRIQYYANTACDASGHGEGEVLLTSQVVDITSGNTLTFSTPSLAYGTREQITATATHDANADNNFSDGSTSEFSACRRVNTLPTFGTAQTLSRQQGSPASNSLMATVADPDQTLNSLAVTVNSGASATVNGVTVSNIAVDASGNVTADVVASCTAMTNATFTLRVTDVAGEFNQQTLTVNVTANTPPTLGTYPNTTVNAGSGGTVTPSAAPADNGTVATLTASAPGFTGTFSGNTTTGVITVSSAGPFGVYTVTVTATDNCGATTTTTFQLTVNAVPTIAAQAGVSRQQGTAVSSSQIATVDDADQTENTLAMTVNGGASATVNGVTVSNIAVSAAGVVTADIVASCTAMNAAFTLRVTDSNGAFTEATLNVTVNTNTSPTVGTYANTLLTPGSGTTVTPTAAPEDNGSIATATATTSGFTGTLSVDAATGVVTISNANPSGIYTVTVAFTDNCGAVTNRQFTLTVAAPPQIAKSFSPATVPVGAVATLTITITNPAANTFALTGVGVTDAFPSGLEVDATPAATNSCSTGTFAPTAGATSISVSGATIPINTACTFTVKVKGTTAGAKVNTTGNVTSANAGSGGTAAATLNVYNSFEADVSPRPTGDESVLTDDVVLIRRFLTGTLTADQTTDEFQRADSAPIGTRGNGMILSDDVVQTRRYQNGTDAMQTTGGPTTQSLWKPAVTKEKFAEQLLVSPQGADREVRVESTTGVQGETVTVNIRVDALGDEAEYGFRITYDSAKLSNPVIGAGNAGASVRSCNTSTAGVINCSVGGFPNNNPTSSDMGIGEIAAGNNQILITVTFNIAADAELGDSPLTLSNVNASTDEPVLHFPTATSGVVTIVGPTAAGATVWGRVLAGDGRGVARATVTLSGENGYVVSAITNPFGYYSFTEVPSGHSYLLSATSRRHRFQARVVSLSGDLAGVDLVAEP